MRVKGHDKYQVLHGLSGKFQPFFLLLYTVSFNVINTTQESWL